MSDLNYLMGAMLDPLVVEFMPPKYCEAMLEAKIRTDEIRGNCPPRAGYVCVLDPRVKGGRYYRKHVEGEGVNALPPSRIEKALSQQESRSQKGEGISFLGKAAIAGGLAVGGLALVGAMANSGRSTEPVPDVPNAKVKPPDTSKKPQSSAYEEGRESAKQEASKKFNKEEFEKAYDENISPIQETTQKQSTQTQPDIARSPDSARKKRGATTKEEVEAKAEDLNKTLEQIKTAVQESKPVPLTKTTQPPNPEVIPEKPKVNIPAGMSTRDAVHSILESEYDDIPDTVNRMHGGYKSAASLRGKLSDLINSSAPDGKGYSKARQEAIFAKMVSDGELTKDGYLIQTLPLGKTESGKIRIPAFMSVEGFGKAIEGIEPPKGARDRTREEDRMKAADDFVVAVDEKLKQSTSLSDREKAALADYRQRALNQKAVDQASLDKKAGKLAPTVAAKPSTTPKPKEEQPKFKEGSNAAKIMGVLGEDRKAIAQNLINMTPSQRLKINQQADNLTPEDAGKIADYLRGINFNIKGAAPERTAFVKKLEMVKNAKAIGNNPPIVEPPPVVQKAPIPVDPTTTEMIGREKKETVRPSSVKPAEKPPAKSYDEIQRELRASEAQERVAKQKESLIKQGEDIKKRTAALQQQLANKEIDSKEYNNAIGGLKRDILGDKNIDDDSPIDSYIAKTNDRYKQLKGEMDLLLGTNEWRNGKGWTDLSSENQELANAKYDEMKAIERDVYSSLGLKFADELNPKKKTPAQPQPQGKEPQTTKPSVSKKQSGASKPVATQSTRSSKKQAPKPEDSPLDIPSAMNNVKIMESDLKNNEALLEKWLNEKVVEVNPQKIANLKKKIANQKKDIKAKQEEVFDYIAKTQQPKQNNDAIAPHEIYNSSKEQARSDALRRFAA